MTSTKALRAIAVAIASAILGVIVAAGLPLSKDLTDHILTLVDVATPVVVAVIGWLHHNHTRIVINRQTFGNRQGQPEVRPDAPPPP